MLHEPEIQKRALRFAPSSADDAGRTVDLVAATPGAGVARFDMDGPFTEILSLEPDAVDLSRLDGMPLLDSHRQDGLEAIIGVVRSAKLENSSLVVSVEISERHEPIWRDIKAGIIRNVSVGYEPQDHVDRFDPVTGTRIRTVTRWLLMEVSLVPVGADTGAKTRGTPQMPEQTTPQTTPATTAANAIQARAAVNVEIRALAETFGIDATVINGLIDRQATVEEARTAILDTLKARQTTQTPPAPRVVVNGDNESPDTFVTRASEALFARINPSHKLSEAARPYYGMSMVDMARECLRLRSIQTTGLTPADIVKRSLQTTSDFPNLLGSAGSRELRAAYEAAPSVLKALARKTTAKDFRAKTSIRLSEAPKLEKVNEKGEFKHGPLAESAESYKIDTYGKIIGLTRQALVNDDLSAFSDLTRKLGQAAVEFENQFLVDLLQQNSGNGPTMSDGKTLFHADHGNKVSGAGAIPSETTLTTGRTALRKQKGLLNTAINVPPKFLLVPAELETVGEKLIADIQPTTSGDVNVFGGKLDLAVEARLTSASRWYIVADPAVVDGLEYAYLQGEEGPQIDTRVGFDIDGVEIRVREDFGAAFTDWRAWYMNTGA